MMFKLPSTELEQWAVLRAAVQAGSFAKAAQQLNRSQSSVSYAIARLQERLGVDLLRLDGRRAVLTPAGEHLLAEATSLIEEMSRLEERGRMFASGREARVRLTYDSIAPRAIIFKGLSAFRQTGASAEIFVTEQVRQSLEDIAPETYDLAVTFWDNRSQYAFFLQNIELVAVAHADHPLHAYRMPLTDTLLSRHPIAIVANTGDAASGSAFKGEHVHLNTLEAAHEAVRSGLCHARLPRHLVADDLASGRLREVEVANRTRLVPLVLTFGNEKMAGPMTHLIAQTLKAAFETA